MKQVKFTKSELDVLSHLLDTQVLSFDKEEIEKEINNEYGYFHLKSFAQAEKIAEKLQILSYRAWKKQLKYLEE
jgi:hypothetical protein